MQLLQKIQMFTDAPEEKTCNKKTFEQIGDLYILS